MKFLLLLALIVVAVAVWRMRVPLTAKILGQDRSRIDRRINRRR